LSAHQSVGRSESRAVGTLADYAISFAPWAGYIAFSHLLGSWKYGFLVGLASSVAIVTVRSVEHDSRFLDVGTLVYCAVMSVVSTTHPTSPIRQYNLPLSLGAVGGISSASLAMKSPFTYRIAREHVPREMLENPAHQRLLYRAHVLATSWWAASQLAAGTASAAMVAVKTGPAAVIAVQSVGTLLPVAATRFHHERATKGFRATSESPGDDRGGSPTVTDATGAEKADRRRGGVSAPPDAILGRADGGVQPSPSS